MFEGRAAVLLLWRVLDSYWGDGDRKTVELNGDVVLTLGLIDCST